MPRFKDLGVLLGQSVIKNPMAAVHRYIAKPVSTKASTYRTNELSPVDDLDLSEKSA